MINSESLIHVVIDPYVLSIYDQDTVCRIADWIQWNDWALTTMCQVPFQARAKQVKGSVPKGAFLWGETASRDLPGGPVAKTLCSKGRGPRFNPWAGN